MAPTRSLTPDPSLLNFEQLLTLLEERGWPHRRDRKEVRVYCPVHCGGALTLKEGENGKALLYCWVCDDSDGRNGRRNEWIGEVLSALRADEPPVHEFKSHSSNGHSPHDLGSGPGRGWKHPDAEYVYQDAAGAAYLRRRKYVERQPREDGSFDKSFFWAHSVDGDWSPSKGGRARILYRLPELLAADEHEPVFLVEGEKDVEVLRDRGHVATTAGAAKDWLPEFAQYFQDRHVILIPDRDEPGQQAADRILKDLLPVAQIVERIDLPYEIVPTHGKDISDWLADNEGLPEACPIQDITRSEGDPETSIAATEPRAQLHYLERPEVTGVLDRIRPGLGTLELDRLLRELPPLPADQLAVTLIRDEIASRLKPAGFRALIADAFIKAAPRESVEQEFEEVAHRLAEPELWPHEVEGKELVEEVRAAIKRFVYIGDDHVYDVLAAWVLHTFMFDEFPTTAYLHITAPSMMSGKTRLLEILEEFCRRALLAGGLSPAVLYRVVEMLRPTLLIDEADTIFNVKSDGSEAIRQVLNNGYTRGKPIFRMVPNPDGSQQPVPFDPYSPKALAGIGRIPGTITSRSITIQMVRKMPGEEADRYTRRERELLHEQAAIWKRKADRWVSDHSGSFDIDPEFPAGLSDRSQDCWEPLFVVGEMIDAGWASRLRAAALHLNAKSAALESQDLGDALLADLKELLEAGFFSDRPHVPTSELLGAMNDMEERPWPHLKGGQGLNAKSLADLMKGFEIRPTRFERNSVRGYAVADIRQALDRWG